ncbi:MAG TPA: hypothetical protein VJN64_16970 [Terriglobales bacterium]|nr:hypothetical protein [Terriglobales bacterium]
MRRCSLLVLVSWMLFAISASAVSASPDQTAGRSLANNDPVYLKLRNIKIGSETIHVKDFVLKKDAGAFTFHHGVFYLLEPVEGKITGAVFLGDASFTLKAPIDVERRNLSLLTHGQPFEEQFSSAVFRFTDKTEDELRKNAVADAQPSSGDPAGLLSDIQQQLKRKLHDNLSARLLEDVISSQPGGKFTAFIKGKKYSDKIIYDVDPHGSSLVSPEEVSLMLWDDSHEGIWAGFHLAGEYAAHTANSDEQNQTVHVDHEKLDVTIDKSARLEGTAQTSFIARQDGVRVVRLILFPTLRVESVSTSDGQPLSFIQEDKKEDPDFAIILPRELKKDESFTAITKYAGKDAVSNEGGGNYFPIARDSWYPGQGFGSYATFDMTFHVPKGLTMVATGKLLKKIDEGNETITQWAADIPQTVAGFNFGKFKREEGKPLKQPYLLETYANPNPPDVVQALQHRNDILGTVIEGSGQGRLLTLDNLGTMSTLGMMKKAMGEAQLSVEIYTDFFGDAP